MTVEIAGIDIIDLAIAVDVDQGRGCQTVVDTDAGVDFLYLFDGSPALPARLFEDGRH